MKSKLYCLYIGGIGYYGALFGTPAYVVREAKQIASGRAFKLVDEDGKEL